MEELICSVGLLPTNEELMCSVALLPATEELLCPVHQLVPQLWALSPSQELMSWPRLACLTVSCLWLLSDLSLWHQGWKLRKGCGDRSWNF